MLCTTKDKRETYVCGIQSFRFCSYAFPNVVTNIAKFASWVEDGLDRIEKQRQFDELYGNGYDYDMYGSSGQRQQPFTDPNDPRQIPPPPVRQGGREMDLIPPSNSRRRGRPVYSKEVSEEDESNEMMGGKERTRPLPRRFGGYYSESYRP